MRVEADTKALEAKFSRLERGADQMALDIVNRLTNSGWEMSVLLAPSRSGELRQGIQPTPAAIVGGLAEGDWHSRSDHSGYVEYGTGRPGTVGAVANGQERDPAAAGFTYTLQTVIQSGPYAGRIQEGWVYYDEQLQRFIHTLGQAAQPFMYPAYKRVQEDAGKEASAVVHRALKE